MLARTRWRVVAEMARLRLSTYDTVLSATPACRATSVMVTLPGRLAGGSPSSMDARVQPGDRQGRVGHDVHTRPSDRDGVVGGLEKVPVGDLVPQCEVVDGEGQRHGRGL